jgi:very-short-patch-repair endonuclease
VAIPARPAVRRLQVSPTGAVQNYILDFVCFEQRVVVEIDGSQHYESRRDETRDAVLASEGFRVIGYWNNDVLQRSASVLEDLFSKLSGETH